MNFLTQGAKEITSMNLIRLGSSKLEDLEYGLLYSKIIKQISASLTRTSPIWLGLKNIHKHMFFYFAVNHII